MKKDSLQNSYTHDWIDSGELDEIPTNPKDRIGAKKPDLSLVPGTGIAYVALAMANGADKYGAYNWRNEGKKVGYMTYLAAAQRHIQAYIDREDNSSDSGVPHLGHAAASLMILVDAIECGQAIDNRPESGALAKVIERYTRK